MRADRRVGLLGTVSDVPLGTWTDTGGRGELTRYAASSSLESRDCPGVPACSFGPQLHWEIWEIGQSTSGSAPVTIGGRAGSPGQPPHHWVARRLPHCRLVTVSREPSFAPAGIGRAPRAPFLPAKPPTRAGHRGRRWADHRRILEAIAWKYRTCTPWRDPPEELGSFQPLTSA
ncbi:transposase [Streptomyces sp. NPDC007907]|uniref:transposase n=1 Tax=Streptomyces sp. NPDC007907 TaxID=3364789 RepID=UPI0036E68E0F